MTGSSTSGAALEGPLFACDRGDVDIFPTVAEMAAYVEVYDLATLEFFDSNGTRLLGAADGFTVRLVPDSSAAPAEPERLEGALRGFFARLPAHLAAYTSAAASAGDLAALVALRQECERTRRMPGQKSTRKPGKP